MSGTKLDPHALSPAEVVTLLKKAGAKQFDENKLQLHLAAGAPKNPDGTIHIVHYTAWLAKRVN